MKKALLTALFGLCIVPAAASAHERQVFTIGGIDYLFVVGSLNEPIAVDDKTGVDLRVKRTDPKNPSDSNAPGALAVEGLEQTLEVEISAGDKKKLFPLSPAYKDPGAYRAAFYPTADTTYSYRIFGTVEGKPFDSTFTCVSGEHENREDTSAVKISDTITRTFKSGGFGCPKSKEDLTFPNKTPSLAALAEKEVPQPLGTPISYLALVVALFAVLKKHR